MLFLNSDDRIKHDITRVLIKIRIYREPRKVNRLQHMPDTRFKRRPERVYTIIIFSFTLSSSLEMLAMLPAKQCILIA